MEDIRKNLADIRLRIAAAAERSGRRAEDVTLVCVTKTRTVEEIKEVIEAGECQLGENQVQEFLGKYDRIQDIAAGLDKKPNIMWNLVGHLQRNKVKYLAGKVSLIHSVDSFRLAEEIDKRFGRAGEKAAVLIQVNTALEPQKSGVAVSECEALVDEISDRLHNVRIKGLMAVTPEAPDPEDLRGYFRSAKQVYDMLAKKQGGAFAGFECLSMGMTHDFEVAIEEGATIVRVGTAIFGPRKYETEDKV